MILDDETALIQKAIDGDKDALERVVARWGPKIHRFATRLCPATEVLDAVQETLLVILGKLSTLRSAKALVSWSFQIVKRQCIKMTSNLRKDAFLAKQLGFLGPTTTKANEWEAFMLAELGHAINKLPPVSRTVLILRDLEGLSTLETAERTGLAPSAVKSRVHRARNYVRSQMSGWVDARKDLFRS